LYRRSLKFPVLVGGAAINRRFGRRILFTEDGEPYEGGVFYCKDAFEGLAVMDSLSDPDKREAEMMRMRTEAERELELNLVKKVRPTIAIRSEVSQVADIPVPPSWGPRVVHQMPLEIVFRYLYKNELFRLSWGAKNTRGEEWERLGEEFESRLAWMEREALGTGWLKPQGVYGYWPVQSNGNDLILYDPGSIDSGEPFEVNRFTFPRQADGKRLCLADYFASVESGRIDVVALQVVTVGQEATERFDALQAAGDYSEAYYIHGLAVQTAEAAAEYLHRHVRRELVIPDGQGKRYSWGYPAIPDLENHRKVFELLSAEAELGMTLTSAWQLVPEQSTAAIIVHHREATYFNIGESRLEQLVK
jgi:5-methyltetrahydrofolate--homocysteine methyltransferase